MMAENSIGGRMKLLFFDDKKVAKAMDQAYQHRVTSMAGMNAADNMRNYADMSAAHAQGMQKMAPAFGTLYGALSPEQKQTADAEFVDHAHQGADKPKT